MRTPSARSARPSRIDHVAPRFQVVEQVPHPLQVLDHLEVFEQMRLAAHDELALLAARPAREPVVDHLLRQLVELGLRRGPRLLQLGPRLGQRLAADARVEEVSGLDQRRGRQADRQIDDAVLDLAVLADQHDQRPFRLQPHEFDVLQPHVRLRGEHHAGGMRQAGQQAPRPRSARSRPTCRRPRPGTRSGAARSRSGRRSASARRRRSAGPIPSAAARPRCAARRSGRAAPGPP